MASNTTVHTRDYYAEVMFAHYYSENSRERVNENENGIML